MKKLYSDYTLPNGDTLQVSQETASANERQNMYGVWTGREVFQGLKLWKNHTEEIADPRNGSVLHTKETILRLIPASAIPARHAFAYR